MQGSPSNYIASTFFIRLCERSAQALFSPPMTDGFHSPVISACHSESSEPAEAETIKQRRVNLFDSIIIASAAQMREGTRRTCFCSTSSQVHSKRRFVGERGENRRASQHEIRKSRITSWMGFIHSAIPHCLTWQRDLARGWKTGERTRCEHMWGFCGFPFWDRPDGWTLLSHKSKQVTPTSDQVFFFFIPLKTVLFLHLMLAKFTNCLL